MYNMNPRFVCTRMLAERQSTWHNTRVTCRGCRSTLYRRGPRDFVPNNHDLDEIFRCAECGLSYCFECARRLGQCCDHSFDARNRDDDPSDETF